MENAWDAIRDFFKKKNAQPLQALKTPSNRNDGSFVSSSLVIPPIVLTRPRTLALSLPLFCSHPCLHGWTESKACQEYLVKLDVGKAAAQEQQLSEGERLTGLLRDFRSWGSTSVKLKELIYTSHKSSVFILVHCAQTNRSW